MHDLEPAECVGGDAVRVLLEPVLVVAQLAQAGEGIERGDDVVRLEPAHEREAQAGERREVAAREGEVDERGQGGHGAREPVGEREAVAAVVDAHVDLERDEVGRAAQDGVCGSVGRGVETALVSVGEGEALVDEEREREAAGARAEGRGVECAVGEAVVDGVRGEAAAGVPHELAGAETDVELAARHLVREQLAKVPARARERDAVSVSGPREGSDAERRAWRWRVRPPAARVAHVVYHRLPQPPHDAQPELGGKDAHKGHSGIRTGAAHDPMAVARKRKRELEDHLNLVRAIRTRKTLDLAAHLSARQDGDQSESESVSSHASGERRSWSRWPLLKGDVHVPEWSLSDEVEEMVARFLKADRDAADAVPATEQATPMAVDTQERDVDLATSVPADEVSSPEDDNASDASSAPPFPPAALRDITESTHVYLTRLLRTVALARPPVHSILTRRLKPLDWVSVLELAGAHGLADIECVARPFFA